MTYFELEVKAKVKDKQKLISFFLKDGWKIFKYYAEDVYFKHPCRNFDVGEELRYRRERIGEKERILLTYKKGDRATQRLEIEARVSDEIVLILENLGFKKELSKIKDGFLFIKGDFKAVLVSVSGSYKGKKVNLGDFLEVEVLAKEKNEEIVKKLEKFALSLPGVSEIDNEFYAKKIVKMITSSD